MDPGTPQRRRRGRPGYDLESLVEVSVQVFIEKGFDGTTMEQLADRLGITKSAIYHHVEGKNELLDLALAKALDGLDYAVERTRALDANSIDRLEYLVRASVEALVAHKPFVTLLLRVRGNTDAERRALARRRGFDHYAAELVRAAEAEGAVRPDVDPEVTARLLFGMINSLVEWARPATPVQVRALSDSVCSIAFGGIRTPEPARGQGS